MMINVAYRASYPSNVLSNLYPNPFTIDGIECHSMEGFLQSLTHSEPNDRMMIVRLYGVEAKRKGNPRWKERGLLYWNGQVYDRHEPEYQLLLDKAYSALLTNGNFRIALKSTGDMVIRHTMGNTDPMVTILTEYEFCSRLMLLRTIA